MIMQFCKVKETAVIHNISVHSMHLGFLFQVVSIHLLRKVNKRPATEKLGISGITLFFLSLQTFLFLQQK